MEGEGGPFWAYHIDDWPVTIADDVMREWVGEQWYCGQNRQRGMRTQGWIVAGG